jgi:hypothetical protein
VPAPSPKVRLAGTAVVTLLLGLGAGSLLTPGGSGLAGAYTLTVEGTLRTSVTCGTTTVHTEGPEARFLAEPGSCEVEAMLSPVMPIRGRVTLSGPGSYTCTRVEVDLHCEGPL